MVGRNEIRLLPGRRIAGQWFLPLVEYTVHLVSVGGQWVSFGTANPMGVVVAWVEQETARAQLHLLSSGAFGAETDWEHLLIRWSGQG